jgi:hypothetical protein
MGASAEAMTQFIHLLAVWGNGPRANGAAREGSTQGASTRAELRGDGVDWACVVNKRDWPPATAATEPGALFKSINALLNTTTLP